MHFHLGEDGLRRVGSTDKCKRGLIPCPLLKWSNLKPGHTCAAGLAVPELAPGQLKDELAEAPCQFLRTSPEEGQDLRAHFCLKNSMMLRSGCTIWQHHGNPLLGRNKTPASMQYPAASLTAFSTLMCTNSSAVGFLDYLDYQMLGHAAPAWKFSFFFSWKAEAQSSAMDSYSGIFPSSGKQIQASQQWVWPEHREVSLLDIHKKMSLVTTTAMS